MKHYQRRESGTFPYFKLAAWNPVLGCWQDGKRQYDTDTEAINDARRPGRYRLSRVDDRGRTDLTPFNL